MCVLHALGFFNFMFFSFCAAPIKFGAPPPPIEPPIRHLVVASGPLWPPNSEIKVFFMNDMPAGQQIVTEKQLIQWMNEWSDHDSSSNVPSFMLTRIREESNIRVQFVEGMFGNKMGHYLVG